MAIAMEWLPATSTVVSKVAFGESFNPQGLRITHSGTPSLFVLLRLGWLEVSTLLRLILAWPGPRRAWIRDEVGRRAAE
jgi:hypothetical protein